MKDILKKIIIAIRDGEGEESEEKNIPKGFEPISDLEHESEESEEVEEKEHEMNQELTEVDEDDLLLQHMKDTLTRVGDKTKSKQIFGSNPKNNMPKLSVKKSK